MTTGPFISRQAQPFAPQSPLVGAVRQKRWIDMSQPIMWAIAFVVAQYVIQILTLVMKPEGILRAASRSAPYLLSIIVLAFAPKRRGGVMHPSFMWACAAVALLAVEIFNANTDGFVAGIAHAMLYFTVLAPILWASRLEITSADLHKLLIVIWAFNTMSAGVGVLQVMFPNKFVVSTSSLYDSTYGTSDISLAAYTMTLGDGTEILRPAGLSDQPGGAAGASLISIILSIGFLTTEKKVWMKGLCAFGILFAIFSIYLSQIRSTLIVAIGTIAVFSLLMSYRGEFGKLVNILILLGLIGALATVWAVAVGGDTVTDRFMSLFADQAGAVFYENRGKFFDYTLQILPYYIFGAGLGRWGMMSAYFGTNANNSLWAEIQWTAWLYDGGVLMMIIYPVALLAAMSQAIRIGARRAVDMIGLWGCVIAAYNVGQIVLTFNYPVFCCQAGMEFWMLNGALFAAAVTERGMRGRAPNSGLFNGQGGGVVPARSNQAAGRAANDFAGSGTFAPEPSLHAVNVPDRPVRALPGGNGAPRSSGGASRKQTRKDPEGP